MFLNCLQLFVYKLKVEVYCNFIKSYRVLMDFREILGPYGRRDVLALRYLKARLSVALGGRVAEEIVCGYDEVTTGASRDLLQVRSIARRMVRQWDFASDALGMTAREPTEGGPSCLL